MVEQSVEGTLLKITLQLKTSAQFSQVTCQIIITEEDEKIGKHVLPFSSLATSPHAYQHFLQSVVLLCLKDSNLSFFSTELERETFGSV